MRRIRAIAALVIVATLGLAPIVGDWCLANCEGSGADPAPSAHCHRAASHGLRIAHAASACGHDHHVAPVARTTETVRLESVSFACTPSAHICSSSASAAVRFAGATTRAGPRSPGPPSIPLRLSASLRI